MKGSVIVIVLLSISIVAPAKAIYCVTCDDCSNPNTRIVNSTCDGQDSCMKIDFGFYIAKRCASHSSMCSIDGFKHNMEPLYTRIKSSIGAVQADSELLLNINVQGRTVLNCCQDRDYCNNGIDKAVNLMALLGILVSYFMA